MKNALLLALILSMLQLVPFGWRLGAREIARCDVGASEFTATSPPILPARNHEPILRFRDVAEMEEACVRALHDGRQVPRRDVRRSHEGHLGGLG